MISVRLPRLALLPLLLVALPGCDDDATSPDGDLGDLNPAELVPAVNALVEPLNASTAATANLNGAIPDLTDAGVEWRIVESPARARLLDRWSLQPVALNASVPALPVSFPPELVGQTFVFNFEGQQWEVDDTRAGAPADGVRLVWYTVDGSGLIRFPLEERGYIDLTPGTGEGDALDILVVETGASGDVVVLDFVQSRASTGDAVQIESFTASGHFADGTLATDFDIASEQSVEEATDDSSYDVEIVLEDSDTRYTMRLDGTQTGATGEYEDRVSSTVVRGGATTILEVVFQGSASSQEDASGTLRHNGSLIANIDIQGSNFSFSTPDGALFSGAQSNDLNAVFSVMTRNGLQVLLNLPLLVTL